MEEPLALPGASAPAGAASVLFKALPDTEATGETVPGAGAVTAALGLGEGVTEPIPDPGEAAAVGESPRDSDEVGLEDAVDELVTDGLDP